RSSPPLTGVASQVSEGLLDSVVIVHAGRAHELRTGILAGFPGLSSHEGADWIPASGLHQRRICAAANPGTIPLGVFTDADAETVVYPCRSTSLASMRISTNGRGKSATSWTRCSAAASSAFATVERPGSRIRTSTRRERVTTYALIWRAS